MSDPVTVDVNHGETVSKPNDPILTGYIFKGWQLNGVNYDFASEVTGDLTLNADWDEEVVSSGFNATIDFKTVTETSGSKEVDLATFKTAAGADASKIVSVSEISSVKQGNGTSGAPFASAAGLIKFGSGSASGSFTLKLTGAVDKVKILATAWTSSEGQLKVNNSAAQKASWNATAELAKGWLEFNLANPTDTIKIESISRVRIFVIELLGGPVLDLASVNISSAGDVTSIEEKTTPTLQLSSVVIDVQNGVVNNASVSWSSSDTSIATVDAITGLVTSINPGTVTITATATRNEMSVSGMFELTITPRDPEVPTKIVLVGYETDENPTLSIAHSKGSASLIVKVFSQYQEEILNEPLVWESSNTAVATVVNGLVTLVAPGSSTIKVSVQSITTLFVEIDLDVFVQKTFKEATSASEIKIGATYVIATTNGNSVMGVGQNSGSNRPSITSTKDGSNIVETENVQILKLFEGSTAGTYAFQLINGPAAGKYLTSNGTANGLNLSESITKSSSWTIAVSGSGAVITNAEHTSKKMRYNTSGLFSAYASGQSAIALFIDTSLI